MPFFLPLLIVVSYIIKNYWSLSSSYHIIYHCGLWIAFVTLMLTPVCSPSAMEVTGLEGTFRLTCHNVMNVLRSNKESLMAVLEVCTRTRTHTRMYTLMHTIKSDE